MGKTAIDASRSNIYNVDPDNLTIIGLDTDDGPEHPLHDQRIKLPIDDGLTANIIHVGKVLEPISVRKNGDAIEVVFGRQRVRSCREANKLLRKEGSEPILVPCQVERGDDVKMLGFRISENEHRRNSSLLQKAGDLQRYLDTGKSLDDAAKLYGVTVMSIRNWQALNDLSEHVRKLIESGKLPVSAALKLAKLPRDEQNAAADELVEEGGATTEKAAVKARKAKGDAEASVKPGVKRIKEVLSTVKGLHPEFVRALKWTLGEIDIDF